jgi:hypothetical protein
MAIFERGPHRSDQVSQPMALADFSHRMKKARRQSTRSALSRALGGK